MWNNLRARHYSVLVLLALVALQTSAIALDRLVFAESEEAFIVEGSFQNNSFIQSFRMADASCAVLPVKINDLSIAQGNKSANSTSYSAPSKLISVEDVFGSSFKKSSILSAESVVSRNASANFTAGSNVTDSYSNYFEYSVQPGDSLSNIAEMFQAKTESIKDFNKIENSNSIKVGQTIKVPTTSDRMKYTVKKGDSLSKIASRFNISMEDLLNSNNLKSHVLMAEQKIIIPTAKYSGMKLAKISTEQLKEVKKINLVKTDKLEKTAVPSKLQLVKYNSRVPMASEISSAKKADISFGKDELVKAPKATVAKSNKPADGSVELKVYNKKLAKVSEPVEFAISPDDEAEEPEEGSVGFSYKVAKGDSLSKIASRFNTTVAQIQTDNGMKDDKVKLGQSLRITPNKKLYRVVKKTGVTSKKTAEERTIVCHKVKAGESLSVIAKKYNTTVKEIVSENNMSNTVVMTGQTLRVPASKSKNFKITKVSSKNSAEDYNWRSPTKGWISSPYGWRIHPVRKKRSFHAGIDIAAPKGTAIYNVAPGRVIYTGSRGGYGKLVIVSHANGFSTRYAHCSKILVKNGQYVKEGQLIGKVGATGVATGPHLHFEVRKNGKTQNPSLFLAK